MRRLSFIWVRPYKRLGKTTVKDWTTNPAGATKQFANDQHTTKHITMKPFRLLSSLLISGSFLTSLAMAGEQEGEAPVFSIAAVADINTRIQIPGVRVSLERALHVLKTRSHTGISAIWTGEWCLVTSLTGMILTTGNFPKRRSQ